MPFLFLIISCVTSWALGTRLGSNLAGFIATLACIGMGAVHVMVSLAIKSKSLRELEERRRAITDQLEIQQIAYAEKYGARVALETELEHAGHHAHRAHQVGHLVGGEAGGLIGAGVVIGAHLVKHIAKGAVNYFETSSTQRAHSKAIRELFHTASNISSEASFKIMPSILGGILVSIIFAIGINFT